MAHVDPAAPEHRFALELEIGGIVIGRGRDRVGAQPGDVLLGNGYEIGNGLVHGNLSTAGVTGKARRILLPAPRLGIV
jgi:hypothetical protein